IGATGHPTVRQRTLQPAGAGSVRGGGETNGGAASRPVHGTASAWSRPCTARGGRRPTAARHYPERHPETMTGTAPPGVGARAAGISAAAAEGVVARNFLALVSGEAVARVIAFTAT